MSQKVLIWSTDIPSVITGIGPIGGINVQLYFWAKIFQKNGWKVCSFTKARKCKKEGIDFYHYVFIKHFDILFEWFNILRFILIVRPQIVISRGARRTVFPLTLICKLFNIKFVFFGASDKDFNPNDSKFLSGNRLNRFLYHKSLQKVKYIVSQNQYQYDSIYHFYKKESLQLLNIWMADTNPICNTRKNIDVIWIANFHKLKRFEWLLNAASQLNGCKFAVIGGPGDVEYFEQMRARAENIENIHFFGPLPFSEVNKLIPHAKLLACTSEFEGFPNTFLQAWSNKIPVISTVNPSNVIDKFNLGLLVKSENDFVESINNLLDNADDYKRIQVCIEHYFDMTHNAQHNYNRLISFISM